MIKSRRMRIRIRIRIEFWWESRKEKTVLGTPRLIWEDNIKMDHREIEGVVWTGLIWLKIGPVEGCWEHGNEPSGSIKLWKILGWLSDWWLLKKGSAPWS
jgi:hypothetical protein